MKQGIVRGAFLVAGGGVGGDPASGRVRRATGRHGVIGGATSGRPRRILKGNEEDALQARGVNHVQDLGQNQIRCAAEKDHTRSE